MSVALNEEQLAAVTHPPGTPALLLAGAGAGKTHVLTQRVVWLINEAKVAPKRILGLTFTNKAANELKERVLQQVSGLDESEAPRITTIHSLSLSLIRRNPPAFGLPPKITPIDDYDQWQLMKRIILREKMEDADAHKILKQIQFHRARGVGFVRDYTKEVHEEALRIFSGYHALRPVDVEAWKQYQEGKAGSGSLDFDDMLHLSIERMNKDAAWKEALQKIFEHILVDECQDLSPTQWLFVNGLMGPNNRNLTIVGDCSQSIMSFNGSNPELTLGFMKDWRGTVPTVYRIVRNHRSVPEIVKLANKIQSGMSEMPRMKMESFRGLRGETGKTSILTGEDPYSIATSIAREITSSGKPFKDFCLLMRSGSQLRDVEGALIRARIPYIVRGGKGILQTEEVRDILSYIRFATNTKDFSALVRAMGAPKRGIGDAKLEKLRVTANAEYGSDLLEACKAAGTLTGNFCDTIRNIQFKLNHPADAIQSAITDSGYVGYIQKKYEADKARIETKLDNLLRFKDMVRGMMEEAEMTVEDMIFQMTMEKPEADNPSGSVVISTIHSAKGLEWQVVYALNMIEGSLPHRFSLGSEAEIQEERRVWYVAATRPQNRFVICVPDQVMNGKYMVRAKPSRFLVELGLYPEPEE